MDGYTVLSKIKSDNKTSQIPIMFLTGIDSTENEAACFSSGAVDYITKPVHPQILLARVRAQLILKEARDIFEHENECLQREVDRRMADNEQLQDVTIRALAHLAEARDSDTGLHLTRMQLYASELIKQLRSNPKFASQLSDANAKMIIKGALLHDIGKVGIPDKILLRNKKLSSEDFEVIKTHAKRGADAIQNALKDVDKPVEVLEVARDIAHWHHEKWDGSGYPDGLKGAEIPISARIIAVADVFDALTSRRVYKEAFPVLEAKKIINQECGHHFDPDVVDAFNQCFDTLTAIVHAGRRA